MENTPMKSQQYGFLNNTNIMLAPIDKQVWTGENLYGSTSSWRWSMATEDERNCFSSRDEIPQGFPNPDWSALDEWPYSES